MGFLVYAYVTRYREDWDGHLRRWSGEQDPGAGGPSRPS
jgi:hypothetical protein